MNDTQSILKNKNILIYGFGKSGFACFNFLKKNNSCKIFDDNKKNIPIKFREDQISIKKLYHKYFDFIVLSPGINMKKCKISDYLRVNSQKIISELDIFEISYPKLKKITITGTNGKSTTSKLLYEVLKNNKMDVRLTGNIGFPILMEKNLKKNTIFIIEASSYQLDYSRYFRSRYSVILNLFPNHLERHGTFKNYAKTKFKIVKSQSQRDFAFIDSKNNILRKLISKNKIKSKIVRINYAKYENYFKKIDNIYFNNYSNKKNFCFVFAIAKVFNVKIKILFDTVNNFKGLNYRQQIVHKSDKLIIINDSKSTSFSSTVPLLEVHKNIYWIVGGLAKKGDRFKLNRKYYKNIKAYIYGKDRNFFIKLLKDKISLQSSSNLKKIIKKISKDLNKYDSETVIIFSPSAASFDQFKNFEDRGKYFNENMKYILKKVKK